MAFHVACPITCRRICYCKLGGFPQHNTFLDEITKLEEFLQDPWILKTVSRDISDPSTATVQVAVPRVEPYSVQAAVPASPPLVEEIDGINGGGGGGKGKEESAWAASVRAKRAELQRQAAEASVAAEDYVRKLEAGRLALELAGEASNATIENDQSSAKIICRICFSGETEGSKSAFKMLPCKTCNKKYHRSCMKVWAEYRDLFHWNSWSCPSCRICEVCRRAGDPTKFKFCKRCDGAYHCYCQQPPHKNVSHGPFLCPKHTRCHSCGSTVPGSGLSTRWFLSYTCCDACGRLFVKGKYCPVCLKVYRDSEMTPMVCCDSCQQWVHCVCDGISDEKYRQFESDRNLHYKCPACRGECYQVKDMEDAVIELWRRRDDLDRRLIASLRAAAGLPTQEESFTYPFSDDEETRSVVLKNEPGKTLKFSVKNITESTTKKPKEDINKTPSKKSSSKSHTNKQDKASDQLASSSSSLKGAVERKATNLSVKESENLKGTKLVIHIGTKNKKASSPKSESSSWQQEPEFTPSSDKDEKTKTGKTSEKPSKTKTNTTKEEKSTTAGASASVSASADPKPLLKLKFKNPYFEQKSSWASSKTPQEEEGEKSNIVAIKGQRSKRKRPSNKEETSRDGSTREVADAEWLLKKLGKDAIGKRVEVHSGSENSWHKGMVADVTDGASSLSVRLDDGTSKRLELGKQKVRFISQKRSKS